MSYVILVWILAALTYCTVGFISIWSALGRSNWFWRAAIVCAMLGVFYPIEAYDLVLIYLVQSMVVIVPLSFFRFFRRNRDDSDHDRTSVETNRRFHLRFSLRDLLLLTLVAALAFVGVVNTPEQTWDDVLMPVIFGVCMGIVTIVAAWLGLGHRRAWLRVIATLVVVPIVMTFCAFDQPTCVIALVDYLSFVDVWVFGLVIAALIAIWLRLAISAGLPLLQQRSVSRRWPRVATVLFAGLVILPQAAIYFLLLTPTPIPEIVLPVPNAYDDLVNLSRQLGELDTTIGINAANEAEYRRYLKEHRGVLDEARVALKREGQVPLRFSSDYLDSHPGVSLARLAEVFRAEGDLAAMEARTEVATTSYLNAIQLGQATARGGIGIDGVIGKIIEELGWDGVHHISEQLNRDQRNQLIEALMEIDANREPLEALLFRDRVWDEHNVGWTFRLQIVFRKMTRDFPSEDGAYYADELKSVSAKCRLLISELAILNYQTDHSRAPGTLAELVPEYLPRVPLDPFSGEPMKYRRDSKGYVLHSIGPDQQDDGGTRPDGLSFHLSMPDGDISPNNLDDKRHTSDIPHASSDELRD